VSGRTKLDELAEELQAGGLRASYEGWCAIRASHERAFRHGVEQRNAQYAGFKGDVQPAPAERSEPFCAAGCVCQRKEHPYGLHWQQRKGPAERRVARGCRCLRGEPVSYPRNCTDQRTGPRDRRGFNPKRVVDDFARAVREFNEALPQCNKTPLPTPPPGFAHTDGKKTTNRSKHYGKWYWWGDANEVPKRCGCESESYPPAFILTGPPELPWFEPFAFRAPLVGEYYKPKEHDGINLCVAPWPSVGEPRWILRKVAP
jgi:hypothetical protein